MCFLSGIFSDASTQLMLKYIGHRIGVNMLNPQCVYTHDFRSAYTLDRAITDYEDTTFYMIIGCNLQVESPILNLRLRRYTTSSHALSYYVGTHINSTMFTGWQHAGIYTDTILDFLYGQSHICFYISKSINPVFFFGAEDDTTSNTNFNLVDLLKSNLGLNTSYNYISTFASDVSIYELGVVSSVSHTLYDSVKEQSPTHLHIVGSYRRDDAVGYIPYRSVNYKPFIIYQGCHLDEDSV